MTVQARKFGYGVPWESLYGFSQALQAGETVYVSGQLSHDEAGTFIGAGDFELQTRTTFDNLDRVLKQFGAARNQIVETTTLVVDLRENFETLARLHAQYFDRHRPTSTAMGVVELALPDQLIEIGAVVRLDLET
ncbi:RidA family protein [Streptomyces cadmiisoli]|uniref:RidA family protein n=1 Tax=Streptomyces cadmiisoli TaxID=2184053 RepID=A0A2Z4ITE5_9ACTN|nr:RidA family protein [Streptomyces cadmiisoli]AWW36024.1 RidA family protein [Streptomyces cadmiisoli]